MPNKDKMVLKQLCKVLVGTKEDAAQKEEKWANG